MSHEMRRVDERDLQDRNQIFRLKPNFIPHEHQFKSVESVEFHVYTLEMRLYLTLIELRASSEYNNSINTSDEGQAYLRRNPQMWQYFDNTQQSLSQYSSVPSGSSINNKMSSDSVGPDLIPRYPASAMIPEGGNNGVVDVDTVVRQLSPDGSPYIPVYPAGGGAIINGGAGSMYDLPSQPELTEQMKYPSYHSVRKHGKYTGASGAPSSASNNIPIEEGEIIGGGLSNGNSLRDLQINVNRRTHHPSSISHSQSSLHGREEGYEDEHEDDIHGNLKNNNGNTVWGNYFPGKGELPSNFLRRDEGISEESTGEGGGDDDVTGGNDPYGRNKNNRRGRYRYLTSPFGGDKVFGSDGLREEFDPNETTSRNGESIRESLPGSSNVGNENIRGANSNDPYQEGKQLQFHHRWRKTADTNPEEERTRGQEEEEGNINLDLEQYNGIPQPSPPPPPPLSRSKRHIGPHDMDGIQRLISTGKRERELNEV